MRLNKRFNELFIKIKSKNETPFFIVNGIMLSLIIFLPIKATNLYNDSIYDNFMNMS